MHNLLFLLSIVLFLAPGCSSDSTFGEPPAIDAPTITVSEALNPTSFGRVVTIRGTVYSVCQQEGCWMTLTDPHTTPKQVLRVQFEGGSWYVPTALTGEVMVTGTVREDVFSEEDAKAIAETMGWSEARLQQMTGDQRIPLFTATGMRILDGSLH